MDQEYPYYANWIGNEQYRNRRINNILHSYDSGTIVPEHMMKLQNDDYGIRPSEILPWFLDSLNVQSFSPDQAQIIGAMSDWNYEYKVDKVAPVYFEVWWRQFKRLLWDELDTASVDLPWPSDFHTLWMLKNDAPQHFIDNLHTTKKETVKDLFLMSLDSVNQIIPRLQARIDGELNWGNYKNTSIIHLSRQPSFGRSNIQVNGQSKTINSTKRSHGPSQRLVVEMTSPPSAWVSLPGGQSGNPGSILYDNMIDDWRDGIFFKIPDIHKTNQQAEAVFTQKLNSK